jgi:hypothetical protein
MARWPKRVYSLVGPPKIRSDGDAIVVEFPMTYALTNAKGTSNGTLQMTMRLNAQKKSFKIVGIQSKTIQAKRN